MMMYYYPPYKLTENDSLEIAVLNKNMVEIAGAQNITFEGIEFTMASADSTIMHESSAGGNGIFVKEDSKNLMMA